MRLQVAIYRHTLPPVNFIYNTSSAAEPVRTVSDLLSALNSILPLESSDGEWGLEDYTVEVAATSDQEQIYECLHFQNVKDVFREDDEIVVRGITSEELRERRQGGRLQITADGRHLIDGIPWGKRWRAQAARPGVIIPPRKRRRLLPAEGEIEDDAELPLGLDYPSVGAQVGTLLENEDEEDDDGDYKDDAADESSVDDEVDSYQAAEDATDGSRQIILRQDFDDDDQDDERSSDEDEDIDQGVDDGEIQQLLLEAADLEDLTRNETPGSSVTKRMKRKREIDDVGRAEDDETVFQGFSVSERQPQSVSPSQATTTDRLGPYTVRTPDKKAQAAENGVKSSSDVSDDTSSSEASDDESGPDPASDSESDSEASSDDDSDDSDETSGLNSDTSEDSDSSSSDGSEVEVNKNDQRNGGADFDNSQSETSAESPDRTEDSKPKGGNPPGMGSLRTRQNNNRVKRRKRLKHLQAAGILSANATLETLRDYEHPNGQINEEGDEVVRNEKQESARDHDLDPSPDELQRMKNALLARVNADSDEEEVAAKNWEVIEKAKDANSSSVLVLNSDVACEKEVIQPQTPSNDMTDSGTPQTRLKLDVAASRRMLFNSLGLRTPKTQAAEEALRQKLAQSIRKTQPGLSGSRSGAKEPLAAVIDDESWRKKLIISAVECIQEGVLMAPPPFPFKQRWERSSEKVNTRAAASKNNGMRSQDGNEDEVVPEPMDTVTQSEEVEMSGGASNVTESVIQSKTKSDMADCDLPIPEDILLLPDLEESDVVRDAIIAYKQLRINQKFEPEMSTYRVARVISFDGGQVELILSKNSRETRQIQYDEETGERIIHGLHTTDDMIDDDDNDNDGISTVGFDEMIEPKLVRSANTDVPASIHDHSPEAISEQDQQEFSTVPESAEQIESHGPRAAVIEQVQVDTPRRQEIANMIKEAGFESVLDDRLMAPIESQEHTSISRSHHDSITNSSPPVHHDVVDSSSIPQNTSSVYDITPHRERRSLSEKSDAELPTSRANDIGSSMMDGTSPPSVSMVETVDYPHVSRIEMNSPSFVEHNASSSYQDAQRISPDVDDIEPSNLSHAQLKQRSKGGSDASQLSMSSELAQSQMEADLESAQQISKERDDSALGLKSHSSHDEEATDSDGLPSLRALTSSQKTRLDSRTSHISPPPLRSNVHDQIKIHTDRVDPLSNSSVSDSEIDFDSVIKASQSQKLANLSQIPSEKQASVVDLTLSSDPAPQPSSEEEMEETPEESTRTRRRNARIKSEGRSMSGGARMMRSALASLGSRSPVKRRKRSKI